MPGVSKCLTRAAVPKWPSASASYSACLTWEFNAVLSPAGPYEVPDEVSDSRPLLVVMNHESTAVPADLRQPPSDIAEIFEYEGTDRKIRELKNNLVFVAADESAIPNMRDLVRRRLTHGLLQKPEEHHFTLADYQKIKIKADYEKLKLDVAMAILQCYRRLFYPSSSRMTGAQLDLGHTIIELAGAGDSPGNGQHQVERVLHEQKKLLEARDTPDSPPFVRDQSDLRVKGEMTTAQIRTDYHAGRDGGETPAGRVPDAHHQRRRLRHEQEHRLARNVMEEQHPHGCGLLSWLRLPDLGRRDHRGDSRPAGGRQPGGRSQVRGPLRSQLHGVDAAQGADHRHGGDPSPV